MSSQAIKLRTTMNQRFETIDKQSVHEICGLHYLKLSINSQFPKFMNYIL